MATLDLNREVGPCFRPVNLNAEVAFVHDNERIELLITYQVPRRKATDRKSMDLLYILPIEGGLRAGVSFAHKVAAAFQGVTGRPLSPKLVLEYLQHSERVVNYRPTTWNYKGPALLRACPRCGGDLVPEYEDYACIQCSHRIPFPMMLEPQRR